MTVRMLTEEQRQGKYCLYGWFVNGQRAYCGKQAVATVGRQPVCQEHLEFVRSSQPTPLEKPFVRSQKK